MRRLYELDAIRGVAALVVAAHHFLMATNHPGLGPLPGIAVDVFFALSGFVMARTYEARLQQDTLSPLRFIGLRYKRLFPPLAIGTTIGFIWICLTVGPFIDLPAAYLLNLAFLPTVWLSDTFPFNLPAWSLFLEIIANALHAWGFRRLSVRFLCALLAAAAMAAVMLWLNGYGAWGWGTLRILSCLPRELVFYIGGIVVFRVYGDPKFSLPAPLRTPAMWLGALSYPLYATHVPVMHAVERLPPVLWPIAAIVVALGVGLITEPSLKGLRTPSARPVSSPQKQRAPQRS